jgi:hypothetical protein
MTNEQLQLLNFEITDYHKLMLNKQKIIASEQNSLQVTAFQKHLHLKKLNGIEEESSKKKHYTFSRADTELEINAVVNNTLELSEVLCRNDDMSVTRRDLLTIWNGPDKWINDVVSLKEKPTKLDCQVQLFFI